MVETLKPMAWWTALVGEGTDHTGDDMSREVFCMMLGHQTDAFVNSGLSVSADCETIDIVPTIANILGFDNDIPGQLSGAYSTKHLTKL